MISTVHRIGDLRERLQEARRAGRRIALVPTMGALHAGHLALVERARELADVVVVSVFVNPLQFGPSEDLDRYPRDLEGDTALLDAAGADLLFAPGVAEMYPDGPSSTRVVAGEVGGLYEGRARPGHFDGMLTVVAKLLSIAQPGIAVFGQKDAQQLFLVRRMVRDLDLPVEIEGVGIVREEDGLARSSRNRYLDEEQRRAGLVLPRLLAAAAEAADRGAAAAIEAAEAVAHAEPLVKLDYLVVVDPATLLPVDADHRGPALVLVAAIVGTTRLLDNAPILLA
ncbi:MULTISPECIES: pantoate--beta-alanine ligase [unclassified Rathayibacter]|uniref:pantoate--beta-alanine ligase n=1 Tax=unclassified Rathayibacter TaxID=2609250 RepID=UPI000CE732CC|nr:MULTISPECIES: pantoate--beta-alanine ligase [unclassified Rathayibacter]PPG42869.1 pantoate--beta-alanine ligase [Rathayibacter sp. AY2B5]PPH11619.1 pantoate--beta-alanine ligase [Rathayibacter sp. AY1C1]